jgi:hypothetical protein
MKKHQYLSAVIAALSVVGAAQAEERTIGDSQAFAAGPYTAFIAPFNKGTYVYGKDYTETITLNPATFPNQTKLTWAWPNTVAAAGVYDFSAIDYGNYYNTIPPSPIPSKTLSNIQTLMETHNISLSGSLQGYDAVIDMFLTTKPGDSSTQVYEIEIFLHTPTYTANYVNSVTPIGQMQVSGKTWTVVIDRHPSHPDILIMPADQSDVTNWRIDVKAMLYYLIHHGIISRNLYFNGYALGTETQQGGGSMKVNSWQNVYN